MSTKIKIEINDELNKLKALKEEITKTEIRIQELKKQERSYSDEDENFITI